MLDLGHHALSFGQDSGQRSSALMFSISYG